MKQQRPSWANLTLLDCSQFVRGVTYTKSDASDLPASGLIPILRANNIQSGKLEFKDLVYVPEKLVAPEQTLKCGDVVVATSSGSISVVGKAAQVREEQPMSFGAFCGVLRPSPVINARYFGHFFASKAYRDTVSEMARGVNINNLKRDHFQAVNIPLAPLAEQKRIADKLDTVLTRVDAVNSRLARVAPLLNRFRQSVLAAATSGRLTEDWRTRIEESANALEDETYGSLPASWQVATIEEIKAPEKYALAIGPFGSNLTTTDYRSEGVPLVFVREIRSKSFGDERTKFVTPAKSEELAAHSVSGGDILITKMGDPPGDVAIYPMTRDDAVITADCIKLRVNSATANNSYIAFALESPAFRGVLATAVAGVAQQKVSLGRFRVLPIPLPKLAEQDEIVRRVETLFAFADRLGARLQATQAASWRLSPSLLAKAFRGELVPQDPNDDPAAVLLCRLQADAPASKPKRGRKASA